MAVALSFMVEGLPELERGLSDAPTTLATAARRQFEAASLLIEAEARTLAPQDTRRLAGSITYQISGSGANLTSRIGPSVLYGLYAERGRRPGRMPPVEALRGWAARHGVNPFVLARSIARKGTKAHPYMQPALDKHRRDVDRLMGEVGVTVVTTIARGQ